MQSLDHSSVGQTLPPRRTPYEATTYPTTRPRHIFCANLYFDWPINDSLSHVSQEADQGEGFVGICFIWTCIEDGRRARDLRSYGWGRCEGWGAKRLKMVVAWCLMSI